MKESKVKKIIEFFEPIKKPKVPNHEIAELEVNDNADVVNAKKGEKVDRNAFDLMMLGARSTTPRSGKVKRLEVSSEASYEP